MVSEAGHTSREKRWLDGRVAPCGAPSAFGAGTPAVPASNPRFARCLTLREGSEEFLILMTLRNMSLDMGTS